MYFILLHRSEWTTPAHVAIEHSTVILYSTLPKYMNSQREGWTVFNAHKQSTTFKRTKRPRYLILEKRGRKNLNLSDRASARVEVFPRDVSPRGRDDS